MRVKDRIHDASVQVHHGVDALASGVKRVGRGTAAGFLGGLVASWMMKQYQAVESRPVKVRREEERHRYATARTSKQRSQPAVAVQNELEDQPAVKLAEQVSRDLFAHELTAGEKKLAGPVVQYGSGALAGAIYGGLSELIPSVSMGLGIPFSTLLWLFGTETPVPALTPSRPATKVTVEKLASDVASHFVYGITLDISRRILRRLL